MGEEQEFRRSRFAPLVQGLLKGLIRLAWRPKVSYVSDRARAEAFREPCVIVSNHIRGMDGAAILTMLPGVPVTALVARDMVEGSRLLRFMMRYLPCMTIDRRHVSLSWLRESRRLLREGRCIYLCPEGRCNFARVIRPFKPGFVTLAAMAGVRVVPIYHNGQYHFLFGKRWRMMVGEPVELTPPPEGLSEQEMQREAEDMRRRVQELELRLNGAVLRQPVDWEEAER